MSNTKKKILEVARNLFNEQSYGSVTIRMIAQELNMSSGNLNYHYKKREDIFEALYFEMVAEFEKRIKELPQKEISISQVREDIKQSMERMVLYKFFWTDLYNVLKISTKVNEHFIAAFGGRIQGCFLLFDELINLKLMKGISNEWERKFLAERMIDYGNTWLYSTGLYDKQEQPNINYHVNAYLGLLYPYLTSKGKIEVEKILK